MYTWTNKEESEAWEANYAECCKHKWTIEKCGCIRFYKHRKNI